MAAVIIIVLCVIVGVPLIVNSVQKSTGRAKARLADHNKCSFCGARLKKNVGRNGFAETCSKCGRTQPWAADA